MYPGLIYIPALLLLLSCNYRNRQQEPGLTAQDSISATLIKPDKLTFLPLLSAKEQFKKLLSLESNNKYLLISEIKEGAECLSMFDENCTYLGLRLVTYEQEIVSELAYYYIADFESTTISIDSTNTLIIQQYYKASGYSKVEVIGFYKLIDNQYILSKADVTVRTQVGPDYQFSQNEWAYKINLYEGDYSLTTTEHRLDSTNNLSTAEKFREGKLQSQPILEPGHTINLEELLGEENTTHFY